MALSVEGALPRLVTHEEGNPESREFLVHAEVALVSPRPQLEREIQSASLILGHEPGAQRERALVHGDGATAQIRGSGPRKEIRPLENVGPDSKGDPVPERGALRPSPGALDPEREALEGAEVDQIALERGAAPVRAPVLGDGAETLAKRSGDADRESGRAIKTLAGKGLGGARRGAPLLERQALGGVEHDAEGPVMLHE